MEIKKILKPKSKKKIIKDYNFLSDLQKIRVAFNLAIQDLLFLKNNIYIANINYIYNNIILNSFNSRDLRNKIKSKFYFLPKHITIVCDETNNSPINDCLNIDFFDNINKTFLRIKLE